MKLVKDYINKKVELKKSCPVLGYRKYDTITIKAIEEDNSSIVIQFKTKKTEGSAVFRTVKNTRRWLKGKFKILK